MCESLMKSSPRLHLMYSSIIYTVIVVVVFVALGVVLSSDHCFDVACASVVSKCMLTQACKCDIDRQAAECTCCRNCTQCLDADFMRCCSCVGLCEPSTGLSLGHESQVGDIQMPFHALFKAFNDAPDSKWTTHTFPIDVTLHEFAKKAGIDASYTMPSFSNADDPSSSVKVNCTVMYWNQCMSVSKCENYCSQYGSASYRYFFDGCCECVGLTCLNYGIDESRCTECSNLSETGDVVDSDKFPEDIGDNSVN